MPAAASGGVIPAVGGPHGCAGMYRVIIVMDKAGGSLKLQVTRLTSRSNPGVDRSSLLTAAA